MAPDGNPGWKRPCIKCEKTINTRLEFYEWNRKECLSCFSRGIANMMWDIAELRIVKCGNENLLAWVSGPMTAYVDHPKLFDDPSVSLKEC